jgi:ABC-type sugar transport system permease subunit
VAQSFLAAFGSSFTAITLAELGDKTFFMALILAARHRARWVFIGAFAALAAVTLMSLALGYGLRELLPAALVPWLAAVLFLAFGFKLLIDAQAMGSSAAAAEAQDAEAAVNEAEQRQTITTPWAVIWEAFALVFIAELGDRTQFATIFLAGLQGIDAMYYEAARIDGASAWACFRRITVPLLRPTILFVVVMSVILSFQVFALVYVMTGGGPAGSTSVLVFYLYQQAFTYFRMGYASAIGFVLFVIIFALTLIQFRAFGKPVQS